MFRILGLSLLALLPAGGARAQDGPGPLPVLPAVPDEIVTSATASAAAPAAAPAGSLFASETEARDRLRQAFARREYSAVLGIADRIHAQFPEATFTRYYEATARLQIRERAVEADKLPFRRLDSLPPSSVIHAMTTVTSAATPAAATAPSAPPSARPSPPPAPAPRPAALARLTALLTDNKQYMWIGGAGLLVLLGLAGLVLARRRAAAAAEEAPDDIFGAPAPPVNSGAGAPAETRPQGTGTTAFFRSEVQAMASGWADSMGGPAAPQPPAETEEDILKPDIEPIFALADDDEDEPPSAVIAPVPAQPDAGDIVLDEDVLSLDEPEPEPPARTAPAAFVEDSLPMVDEPRPEFPPGQVGESLYIDEAPPTFDLPAVSAPARSPAAADPGTLDLLSLAGLDASDPEPAAGLSTVHSPGAEDSIAMAADVTQTAYPESNFGEETIVSLPQPDAPPEAEPAAAEAPAGFQLFHPGQTVTVHMEAEDEPAAAAAPAARPKEVKVDPQDVQEDVFDREYKAGLRETDARNWIEAIHHLSIAAALRPGALEVKEHLREARRMRARELEGRG